MYTYNDNPAVNTALCPSRLFGGPDRRFLPNVVLRAGDPAAHATWHPIDGTVGDATRGPLYVVPHVTHAVYVSRCVRAVRILTLTWDTPDAVYVMGGLLPRGWHECRLVTAELLDDIQAKAVAWESADAGGVDEWKRAEAAAKVRDLVAAWEEAQAANAAAAAWTPSPVKIPESHEQAAQDVAEQNDADTPRNTSGATGVSSTVDGP